MPLKTPPPDESNILRSLRLLEAHNQSFRIMAAGNATLTVKGLLLESGTEVDAKLIAAPSSNKNSSEERDPKMHQTKKGKKWHFGMKSHIGVDADSGLVHTVVDTAPNVNDVTHAHPLVHGEEIDVFADAGYQGVSKREEAQDIVVDWHAAIRLGWCKVFYKSTPMGAIMDKLEQAKTRIQSRVKHPFPVVKRQFSHVRVHYRGLAKSTAQLHTLFALSNLWMARRPCCRRCGAECAPQAAMWRPSGRRTGRNRASNCRLSYESTAI